jgi:hypothetical protein
MLVDLEEKRKQAIAAGEPDEAAAAERRTQFSRLQEQIAILSKPASSRQNDPLLPTTRPQHEKVELEIHGIDIEYWIAAVDKAASTLKIVQTDSTTPAPHKPMEWAAWASSRTTKAALLDVLRQYGLDKSGSKETMIIRLLRTLAQQQETATRALTTKQPIDPNLSRRK